MSKHNATSTYGAMDVKLHTLSKAVAESSASCSGHCTARITAPAE
jgi:hypothetical protein